jgi:hypothetical protein
MRSFFTGPECTSVADLTAPVLDSPADGAVVDTLAPWLRYHPGDPGCIPDAYLINLQTDPAFGGLNLMGAISEPSTAVSPDPALTDCTLYYWKVNAIQGGSNGPESGVRSFFVNESGTCLPPGVPGTAKANHFCREGTFADEFPALWTINEGDRIFAIARNPLSTYLYLTILNQETGLPFDPEIRCWSYIGSVEPDEPYSFGVLGPMEPPPTKTPEPECHENMNAATCLAFNGVFNPKDQKCYCPY